MSAHQFDCSKKSIIAVNNENNICPSGNWRYHSALIHFCLIRVNQSVDVIFLQCSLCRISSKNRLKSVKRSNAHNSGRSDLSSKAPRNSNNGPGVNAPSPLCAQSILRHSCAVEHPRTLAKTFFRASFKLPHVSKAMLPAHS